MQYHKYNADRFDLNIYVIRDLTKSHFQTFDHAILAVLNLVDIVIVSCVVCENTIYCTYTIVYSYSGPTFVPAPPTYRDDLCTGTQLHTVTHLYAPDLMCEPSQEPADSL